MDKDINRIKVVLAEKNQQMVGRAVGDMRLLWYPNGVPMTVSQLWRRILKLQTYSTWN